MMEVLYIWIVETFFSKHFFMVLKNQIWRKKIGALIFFLTMELKSVNSISSSFGKTLKHPINFFLSQTLAQMASLGNNWFWGPKSKNPPITLCNIVVKNLQHVFWQSAKIRVIYYLDKGNFTTINSRPQYQIWGTCFWDLTFFLSLELKLVNSISSSFGKKHKRPINYFSQTLG